MSPLTKKQLNQIRDERREQIKKAALKVFARRGITGTTMRMIASEAGISLGLSYSYFKSKDELLTQLVQEAMEEAHGSIQITQLAGTPTEQIKTLSKAMLDESNKQQFLLIQQVQTSDEVPEEAKQVVEQYSTDRFIEQLVPILTKGQQTGEFCAGDPKKLLFLYFSVVTGLMLQDTQGKHNYQSDVDLLMKILAN